MRHEPDENLHYIFEVNDDLDGGKQKLKGYLANRLRERSTWEWLAGAMAAAGALTNPEDVEAFIVGGIAVMSMIGIFLPDRFGE